MSMLVTEAQPTGGHDSIHVVPAAITDTGCERDLNEDRYAVVECQSGIAWVVCDGMGGVTGGELAAQLVIDALRRDLENAPRKPIEIALRNSILEANRVIVLRRQNPAFSSMGTTIVAALFFGSEVAIGHVGDSRAYLVRDCAIQQLTTDHTLVQEMVDRGQLQPEDALTHPQAHILTKCIGSEPGLDVPVKKFWVWDTAPNEPRDFLMLCTDGLYSHVSDAEMAVIISRGSPQRACVELVELAKSRGGLDNITVNIIPLAGQLKREPPIGYGEVGSEPTARHIASGSPELGWGKVLIGSAVLTFLSIIVVILITVLFFV